MYYTYILWSETKDIFYVGHTRDLDQRLEYHNSGRTNFSKRGIPWKMVYFEEFQTKAEAARREIEIKKRKSRKYIQSLILKKATIQSVPSRIPDS